MTSIPLHDLTFTALNTPSNCLHSSMYFFSILLWQMSTVLVMDANTAQMLCRILFLNKCFFCRLEGADKGKAQTLWWPSCAHYFTPLHFFCLKRRIWNKSPTISHYKMVFSTTMLLHDFICCDCYEGTIILLHSRMTQSPAFTQRISCNTITFCIIPGITEGERACFIPENITGAETNRGTTFHSKCWINKGLIKRGSTIDHWR
jgi:hypothetical protein